MILKHCIAITLTVLYLGGCASSSVFNPYPKQAAGYQKAMMQGSEKSINMQLSKLKEKRRSADGLLYAQERGRLHQLKKNYAASREDFDYALQRYKYFEDRARISTSAIFSQTASLVSNENAIPYQGEAYEKVLVHQFQAFNYLGLGDIAGAAVELRRASNAQRLLEVKHEKTLAKINQQNQKEQLANHSWQSNPNYQAMHQQSANLKNSFLNAYTYYSSAIFWEAEKNYNRASVDYKKALNIKPSSQLLRQAVNRVEKQQPFDKSADQGRIVVLFEEGFVPAKRSFSLSVPSLRYNSFFSIAVPYYSKADFKPAQSLHINIDDQHLGHTEILADIGKLANKALHESMPGLILRQILRARTKYELNQKAKEVGELTGFFSTPYNIISEQADLRSWLTLPNSAQAMHSHLSAGQHSLQLSTGKQSITASIEVIAGHTTLIRVIKTGPRFVVDSFIL